jgi:hypothetical protein
MEGLVQETGAQKVKLWVYGHSHSGASAWALTGACKGCLPDFDLD